MTEDRLEKANIEARKFIARVRELKKELEHQAETYDNPTTYIFPSKLSGAVRRQSMELTRALADLRRSN